MQRFAAEDRRQVQRQLEAFERRLQATGKTSGGWEEVVSGWKEVCFFCSFGMFSGLRKENWRFLWMFLGGVEGYVLRVLPLKREVLKVFGEFYKITPA